MSAIDLGCICESRISEYRAGAAHWLAFGSKKGEQVFLLPSNYAEIVLNYSVLLSRSNAPASP